MNILKTSTINSEVMHTAIFNTQDDCIINPIVDYFLYSKLPAKNTSCPWTEDPFKTEDSSVEMVYKH